MSYFKEQLKKIKQDNLFRSIPKIENGWAKYVKIEGKSYLNLASNNYLGLAESDYLKNAAEEAIKRYSCSSSASRIVTGNYTIYDELEDMLAKFKGTQKALVFNTGYVANLSIISSICTSECVIFSDKLNHASIIDGILLSKARFVRFRHRDLDHLLFFLKKYKESKQKLIVTDSIFSMDGDLAKLDEIVKLAKDYNALTIIDEAHATGVFGEGKGLVHQMGLEKEVDIQMSTFSKALGSFGAFVASRSEIIDFLINKARGFIYSTSLPPAVIAANKAAVEFVIKHKEIGRQLLEKSERIRSFLKKLGFDTANSNSQIIPIIIGDKEKLFKVKEFMMEKGILVAAIRPPTVPRNTERLRISMRADLDDNDIKKIENAFLELKRWI